ARSCAVHTEALLPGARRADERNARLARASRVRAVPRLCQRLVRGRRGRRPQPVGSRPRSAESRPSCPAHGLGDTVQVHGGRGAPRARVAPVRRRRLHPRLRNVSRCRRQALRRGMRGALPEFGRFLVAGAVNTLASYAIYFALLQFIPYLAAYTIAYLIG